MSTSSTRVPFLRNAGTKIDRRGGLADATLLAGD